MDSDNWCGWRLNGYHTDIASVKSLQIGGVAALTASAGGE
jgi:hypothetical protein